MDDSFSFWNEVRHYMDVYGMSEENAMRKVHEQIKREEQIKQNLRI